MKTTEIREMSDSELDSKLAGLKEELFNLRFQDHSASTRVKCLSVFEV